MQIQSRDLERAFTVVGGKENPARAVGSIFGFSGEEMQGGVPTWAWAVLALGAGIYIGVKLKGKTLF